MDCVTETPAVSAREAVALELFRALPPTEQAKMLEMMAGLLESHKNNH